MSWSRPISTSPECAARRAAAISRRASPTLGIRIATRGTRRRPVRSIGGCRSTSSNSANAMAFHPRYWNERVANSSAGYNYYTWNKLHRGESVAKLTKEDNRPLPRATEPIEIDPQNSPDLSGRWPHLVFRGANALERAQHVGRHTFQHRFSHRPSPRLGREKGRTERRRGLHGHGVAGLPARYRFDAVAGGCRRAL